MSDPKMPAGRYREMGLFLPAPTIGFSSLVKQQFRIEVDWLQYGCMAELRVDERLESMLGQEGTFKSAHPGSMVLYQLPHRVYDDGVLPFGVNVATEVAVKRWRTGDPAKGVRVGKAKEEQELAGELTNLIWGQALLSLAYSLIDDFKASATPNQLAGLLPIPTVRFVKSGLFRVTQAQPSKEKSKPSRQHQTYLIEERIGTAEAPAHFVKYIHNSSPSPRCLLGAEGDISEFLSFTQHAQFQKTNGLVYVSDYQGAAGLLTDPQIMTNPDVEGVLFGGGNAANAFSSFAAQHVCQKYCLALGLTMLPQQPAATESDHLQQSPFIVLQNQPQDHPVQDLDQHSTNKSIVSQGA
ncbi:hypothetical protein CALCODRAFT_483971 [Calocera cornea HHB12733]|uniref:Alpha-type protein kinase domain-containing protein n=1 Tax=Calocera cornea HHB12733 TaxID=1353952 RepID=A0A165F8L5_9BASI|nr:hypothetical protein CALCODRAFT_483971 [Calocera cornea HHB12733]